MIQLQHATKRLIYHKKLLYDNCLVNYRSGHTTQVYVGVPGYVEGMRDQSPYKGNPVTLYGLSSHLIPAYLGEPRRTLK